MTLQLKAFLILAQTISACSTSARKQDDLRQLADSSRTARGQLATRSARWTARVPDLSNHIARDNISSRSDQFQLAVHLFGASAQGVPDPSSDDLGLFNLSSQTRRSQTARGQLATRSARWTARVPDLSNQTARDNISSRSDQFQLAVHLFGGPFNPT
ncbi:hypothetical protein F2Q69_00030948 [Brassica cretica]|uniref:Uncharacterized protein n=1 Tax=Brassica cretica TaxID=69181 RepID=A0A8S9S8B1_BRACR|nr:hypothetical protein F2Q69_00030948 [Brassica cretica]